MAKKNLIFVAFLAVALTILLSGCSGSGDELEGKNIVTFDVNGGILSYGTSSTDTKLNFAYHPGTYIVDPSTISNYSITRNGYNFTGWYTEEGVKWDFSTAFDIPSLTLYAGWEKAVVYSYTLYYTDGDGEVSLGSYQVRSGEGFEDWRGYADGRDDYTSIGYFTDAECTVEWDFGYAHPGGDADLDIPVYVKYIEGEWELVDSYDKLKSAANSGNVYLTSDIDCGGGELFFSGTFDGIFEGNGYTISNFTVNKSGTPINPASAIFQTLGSNAEVRNVAFDSVTFNFFDIRESTDKVEVKVNVAALAVNMTAGARVSCVSVSGTLMTNYNGEFPCISEVYYHKDEADPDILAGVTDFTADITVDKQS